MFNFLGRAILSFLSKLPFGLLYSSKNVVPTKRHRAGRGEVKSACINVARELSRPFTIKDLANHPAIIAVSKAKTPSTRGNTVWYVLHRYPRVFTRLNRTTWTAFGGQNPDNAISAQHTSKKRAANGVVEKAVLSAINGLGGCNFHVKAIVNHPSVKIASHAKNYNVRYTSILYTLKKHGFVNIAYGKWAKSKVNTGDLHKRLAPRLSEIVDYGSNHKQQFTVQDLANYYNRSRGSYRNLLYSRPDLFKRVKRGEYVVV